MLGHRWPPTGRKLSPDVRIKDSLRLGSNGVAKRGLLAPLEPMLEHLRPLTHCKLSLGSNGVSKRGLLAPLEPMLGHRWPPAGRKRGLLAPSEPMLGHRRPPTGRKLSRSK